MLVDVSQKQGLSLLCIYEQDWIQGLIRQMFFPKQGNEFYFEFVWINATKGGFHTGYKINLLSS